MVKITQLSDFTLPYNFSYEKRKIAYIFHINFVTKRNFRSLFFLNDVTNSIEFNSIFHN